MLNIPVLPGEAARLVTAWSRVRSEVGEISNNVFASTHTRGFAMSCGLLSNSAIGSISEQAGPSMSDAQSDLEFFEAQYDAGTSAYQ